MNIAFPALLIAILLLPGFLLRYSYSKGIWISPTSLRTISDELTYVLILAPIIHFLAGLICHFFSIHINYRAVLILLLGTNSIDGIEFQNVLLSFSSFKTRVFLYFFLTSLFSYLTGFGLHRIIRYLKLDLRYKFLRFNNQWYYLFTGEILLFPENNPSEEIVKAVHDNNLITYITAVVTQGNETYLYRGYYGGFFFFEKDGSLSSIYLESAHRRKINNDRDKDTPHEITANENNERYYMIEGDIFILRYSEVKTLNIEYALIEKDTSPTPLLLPHTSPSDT